MLGASAATAAGAAAAPMAPRAEMCRWHLIGDIVNGSYRGTAVLDGGSLERIGDESLYILGGYDVPQARPRQPVLRRQVHRLRLVDDRPPPQPWRAEDLPLTEEVRYGHTAHLTPGDGDERWVLLVGGSDVIPSAPVVPSTPAPTPTPAASPTPRSLVRWLAAPLARRDGWPFAAADGIGASAADEAIGPLARMRLAPSSLRVTLQVQLAPPVLDHASVAIDARSDGHATLILHGGRTAADRPADVATTRMAATDGTSWSVDRRLPGGRYVFGHTLVWNDADRDLILFGGSADPARAPSAAVDHLTVPDGPGALSPDAAWLPLDVAPGPGPVGRLFHAAVFDPLRGRMVVVGGQRADGVALADTWVLDVTERPARWTLLDARLPRNITGAAMAFDAERGWPLLVGGSTTAIDSPFADPQHDVWALVCDSPDAPVTPVPIATTPAATATVQTPVPATPTALIPVHPSPQPTDGGLPMPSPRPATRIRLPIVLDAADAGPACSLREAEPNGTVDQALRMRPICEDAWYVGWHSASADRADIAWFTPGSGLLKVWLEDIPTGVQLDLHLYDLADRRRPLQSATQPGVSSKDVGAAVIDGHTYAIVVLAQFGESDAPYRLRWTLDRHWP